MKDWSIILKETLDCFSGIENFKSLSSNYERIEYLIGENIVNVIDSYLNEIESNIEGKNGEVSAKYRKQGNEYYGKRDNKTALKYYTLALLNAPESSESLLLAYSNRSAVFFDLKRFEQCLYDLNRAKSLILDDAETRSKERLSLILKLLAREVNCHVELNRPFDLDRDEFVRLVKERFGEIDAKISSLQSIVDNNRNKQKQNNDVEHKHDETCEKENEVINYISESVEIVYSKEKGRHCRANREIKAGECLFVEKAYCAIVLPEFALYYCPTCFRRTYDEVNENFLADLNLEPCDKCTSVLYCSGDCKKRENENGSHKYECEVLSQLLHNLGIAHLAYRIVASTSLDLLKKYIRYEIDRTINVDVMKIDYKNKRDDDDYEQVFNLMTHENDTHVEDLFKYTLTSILLGKVLLMKSDNLDKTNYKMLSCLILRHILQSICNAHAMTQLHDRTTDQMTYDREQIRFATAIYPRVSLLNHSCNSNVISSFKPNSRTIVVKAARDIQNNDEIFNCYGPHYLKMGLLERQQSLLEQYRFRCDCDECVRQLNGLKSQSNSSLKCLKCKSDELFVDCGDTIQLRCSKCKLTFTYSDYISLFDKLNYHLSQIDTNIANLDTNRKQIAHLNRLIVEYRGYLLLNEKLEIDAKVDINDTFRLFYVDFSKAVDLLARLYCNLREFQRACELVESNIRLLERIYALKGSEKGQNQFNIELANELFKLAEIQCNCEKWSKALESVNRSIRIAENVYSKDNNLISEFKSLKENILSILS